MRGLLLVIMALVALSPTKADAFEPWNVRHWPGTTTSPMNQKVGATSTLTWQAVDLYGWSGWRNVVARSLDSGSSDPDSLANVYNRFLASENRGQITIREAGAGEEPDIVHHAASTAFVEAKCGTGSYTACVYLLNPVPRLPAYYKAAAMITWAYSSQAAVVRHETNHPLARSCDQYRGGCPRASDGVWESSVVCTGNPDTLMDCGGAARTATYFDYVTFITAYPPNTPFLQIRPVVDPCAPGPTDQFGNVWLPCQGVWQRPNGWLYDPATGNEYLPNGTLEWLGCTPLRHRWSVRISDLTGGRVGYFEELDGFFDVERGFWSFSPPC